MDRTPLPSAQTAADITKSASKQTYYTIRFLVDRDLVEDAYRAYGYFRWVDDVLDGPVGSLDDKLAFLQRQQTLLDACYQCEMPQDLCAEEWMLVDLVHNHPEKDSGLQMYLGNMMGVMAFDARRRGRLITQAELTDYSDMLAKAVTEALYFFIGHCCPSKNAGPQGKARYLAVNAAHITHMLRDAYEDAASGYYNISSEYLQSHQLSPKDVDSCVYQDWVQKRVQVAQAYFKAGRECTAQVKNLRCRLAGYLYISRFQWMLRTIEHDHYQLRPEYPERKSLRAALWMGWTAINSIFSFPSQKHSLASEHSQGQLSVRTGER